MSDQMMQIQVNDINNRLMLLEEQIQIVMSSIGFLNEAISSNTKSISKLLGVIENASKANQV